mmetsp:Transcript_44671/g.87607  ORF Transcript_44671/g.87607 Transcript_44671/m.87607 type:complete len:487 (-) Transcript_44671:121-1581(-)
MSDDPTSRSLFLGTLFLTIFIQSCDARRRGSDDARYYYGHRQQKHSLPSPWMPGRWSVEGAHVAGADCYERDVSYTSAVHNAVSAYLREVSDLADDDFGYCEEENHGNYLNLQPSQFDWHTSTITGAAESVRGRAKQRTALVSNLIKNRQRAWRHVVGHAADEVQTAARNFGGSVGGAALAVKRSAVSNLLHITRDGDEDEHEEGNESSQTLLRVGLLQPEERLESITRADSMLEAVRAGLEDESLWTEVTRNQDAIADNLLPLAEGKHRLTKVWRTYTDMKRYDESSQDDRPVSDVPTILSRSFLDAPPDEAFALFCNNDRVHEYNENCQELVDIEDLDHMTKVNWCATGKFGPFKARDFVSLVHHKVLGNGEYASVACNVVHSNLPPAASYVRSEIALAATFFRPVPGQPGKTTMIQMTQVGSLGGCADSALAKRISNNLQEQAPIEFMRKFNKALISTPRPKKNTASAPFPHLMGPATSLTEA